MTLLDIITDALSEIGAYSPFETVSAEDAALGMRKLFYLLDEWAARKTYVYTLNFAVFTLIAGKGPHLIGQGASITNTALVTNVATFTAPNNFKPGDSVTISGTTNGAGAFNVAGNVLTADATKFTLSIVHADITTHADSGTAYPSANAKPDFPVFARPVRVEGGSIILNTTPTNVDVPFEVRDDDWWNYQRVKTLQSNIPTDLYYDEAFPNGALNFWPIPNFAYGVRLEIWGLLQSVTNLNDVFSMPPAYANAVMLTLAESLAPVYERQVNPQTVVNAQRARKAVQSNNDESPRISTSDTGVPQSGGQRKGSTFNWLTGGQGS